MNMIVLIVEVWIAVIVGVVVTLFILKARNAGKTTIIKLKGNHTYEVTQLKTKGNELFFNKQKSVKFSPLDFFEELKPSFKFWRNPKRILFYLDGSTKALSWDKDEKGDLTAESLSKKFGWSIDEATEYIKKLAKKAAVEARPISQNMFYILVAVGVINLLMLFFVVQRLGGF
jgi:hypothetical protein